MGDRGGGSVKISSSPNIENTWIAWNPTGIRPGPRCNFVILHNVLREGQHGLWFFDNSRLEEMRQICSWEQVASKVYALLQASLGRVGCRGGGSMMRIVLADPPQKQQFYDLSYANLGILYLASYLQHNLDEGLEVHYLEGHHTVKSHLEEIGRLKPDLYGLSFAYPLAPLAYQTLNAVKDAYPALLVVCGGPHPTSSAEDVLRNTKVDICVVGEGEETLLELVKYFGGQGTGSLLHIPGIAFREADGTVRFTPKRRYIEDLDSIPYPLWDMIDLNRYDGMHFK